MLPLTQRTTLPSAYGMRHKAAIGVTEELDVVAILVSEETGDVGIVNSGIYTAPSDKTAFRDRVHELLAG